MPRRRYRSQTAVSIDAWCLPLNASHETLRAVSTSIWFWAAFNLGVFLAVIIDLVSFKRRDRELSVRAAALRSVIWIVLSLLFNLVVWRLRGPDKGLEFLTGYVIEYSLSVDNIFVFVLIFSYFRVPPIAQHRVLVWGILGALIMRGIMIFLGVALVQRFSFVLYIFGVFLIITAVRIFFTKPDEEDFGNSFIMRCCKSWVRVTPQFYGEDFKAQVDGRWMLTPLALALVVIDVMDLVFAIDSIPAVFAITTDAFIVYTSNICAILGLRSLYFLVAKLIDRFIYLKIGIALVLGFVGFKMVASHFLVIPTPISLAIILSVLTATITVSVIVTKKRKNEELRNGQ
jgi:tellurite resistance protein TerC